MKNLTELIIEKLRLSKDTNIFNYHPKTRDELKELVKKLIEERGNKADLNDIDTSEITDMVKLFYVSKFNGDISNWNVSSVKNMGWMFAGSEFNGDISDWDVSNVKNMRCMFSNSDFTSENGDISKWDVSNIEDMFFMFKYCPLEKNPPKWYKP